jgi:hypothetical protein
MFAVQPLGFNGGDEELRAVAEEMRLETGESILGGLVDRWAKRHSYVFGPALAMDSVPGSS